MKNFLLRSAALLVCLVSGTGAITALLSSPRALKPENDMQQFLTRKKAQPIKHADDSWTLLAAGDVMLSRYVATMLKKESNAYPYERIGGLIHGADIAFANLENPVGPGPAMPEEGLKFKASPEAVKALQEAGFDVVSLANNHQSDIGQAAIGATVENVRAAGLKAVGAGIHSAAAHAPEILKVKGHTVAFLAYGEERFDNQVHFASETKPGIALAEISAMKSDITSARTLADIVIVSLHAGAEYQAHPDEIQKELVQAAVDAGAHIVLGHHPHVIQPLAKIGETWVIYSMGNLVFDQMWSEETRRGMMLQFHFTGTDLREIEALPVRIENSAQPQLSTATARTQSLKRLQFADMKYATEVMWEGPEKAVRTEKRGMPLQESQQRSFSMEKEFHDNLNGNRLKETYALHGGMVSITEEGLDLWESPADWWVQDMALADIDGNHRKEVILSVWKSGNYGSSKPFWVEKNDLSVRNHMFVYGFENGRLVPLWQSSNLPHPNCEIQFADLDGDGAEELVALEGAYDTGSECSATTMALWKWNNWGFFNEWRSKEGVFWNIRSEVEGTRQRVVANGTEW